MRKFAIFIATTGGPVQIERLTEESAPQSMICISGATTILSVSKEYNDYVRRGSGIIEREFGPFEKTSFRMDVSGDIGAGNSWQLGVFLAHAIEASDKACLVSNIIEADQVIWATGRVDYDLNILKVGHIPEKLESSDKLFNSLNEKDLKVSIIFPVEQKEEFDDIQNLLNKCYLSPIKTAKDLWDNYNWQLFMPTLSAKTANPINTKHFRKYLISGAGLLAVLMLGLFILYRFSDALGPNFTYKPHLKENVVIKQSNIKAPIQIKKEDKKNVLIVTKPKPSIKYDKKPHMTVFVSRPPPGKRCIDVIFSDAKLVRNKVELIKGSLISDEYFRDVCRFIFKLDANGSSHAAIWLNLKKGRLVKSKIKPIELRGLKAIDSPVSWEVEIPHKFKEKLVAQLILLRSNKPLDRDLAWLKKQDNQGSAFRDLRLKGIDSWLYKIRISP